MIKSGSLLGVSDGFIEFAFAEARAVGQFEHGAVMWWLPLIRTWAIFAFSTSVCRIFSIIACVGPRPMSRPTIASLSSPARITTALAKSG